MSQEFSTEFRKLRSSDIPTASAQQMQTKIYFKKYILRFLSKILGKSFLPTDLH